MEGNEPQMLIGKDILSRAGKDRPPAEESSNPWEEAWVGISSQHRRLPFPLQGDQSQTKGNHSSLPVRNCSVLCFDTQS